MAGNEQDELEKIMSEIEELQKEMTPGAPAEAATVATAAEPAADVGASMSGVEEDILREIQATARSTDNASGQAEEASLEDTLGDLKEEVTGGLLGDDAEGVEAQVAAEVEEIMSKEEKGSDGTLSMTLTGNMTLKLKYEFEGQEVTISFVDQSLRVQMTDGTEFKVPVSRNATASNVKAFKKAV